MFFLHNRARNSKLKRIAISGRLLILVGVMYEKFNVDLQDFEMLLGFSVNFTIRYWIEIRNLGSLLEICIIEKISIKRIQIKECLKAEEEFSVNITI